MKTQLQISIPAPCHESWANMDATDKGAFCHSCRKEVIDFSTMTDREVIDYLQKHATGCGRFRTDQLNANLSTPKISNGLFKWKAMFVGLLPILSAQHLSASEITPPATDQSSIVDSHKKDTTLAPIDHDIEICGTVFDEKGEKLMDSYAVLVDASGRNTKIASNVDSDGNFSLLISKEAYNDLYRLKVVCLGYQSIILRFTKEPSQYYNIEMKPPVVEFVSSMVFGGLSLRKRTPAQKIKYWIRRTFHIYPKHVKGKIKL